MGLRVTLFYNQFAAGWSETWFKEDSSPPALIPPLDYAACEKAIRFRARGTILKAIRYTADTANGQSNSFALNLEPYKNYGETDTVSDPDIVAATCVFKLSGAVGVRRRIFLRGMEDIEITRSPTTGADILDATTRDATDAFWAAAKTAGWKIRQQVSPKNAVVQQYAVLRMAPSAGNPNYTEVFLTSSLPWQVAPIPGIRFTRIPFDNLPGFPRKTVPVSFSLVSNSVTIPYRMRQAGEYAPPVMKALVVAYTYPAFTTQQFERFSFHKTGRPFGSLRGRSRSLVRAL
jgi:hypothetical protein